MTRYDIGYEGEKLVFDWFKNQGHIVEMSTDRYDVTKDLSVDGQNMEIKTQTIYRKFPCFGETKPAFTVPVAEDTRTYRNQLSKCMNVDRLIFVARSSEYNPFVHIYEAPRRGERNFTLIKNKNDGRYVAGFFIESMELLDTISDANIVENFMDEWKSGRQ